MSGGRSSRSLEGQLERRLRFTSLGSVVETAASVRPWKTSTGRAEIIHERRRTMFHEGGHRFGLGVFPPIAAAMTHRCVLRPVS